MQTIAQYLGFDEVAVYGLLAYLLLQFILLAVYLTHANIYQEVSRRMYNLMLGLNVLGSVIIAEITVFNMVEFQWGLCLTLVLLMTVFSAFVSYFWYALALAHICNTKKGGQS